MRYYNFFISSVGRLRSTATREGKGEKSTVDATEEGGREEEGSGRNLGDDVQNVASREDSGANGESEHLRRYIAR